MANPILSREFGESKGEDPASRPVQESEVSLGVASGKVMTKASVTFATLGLLALVVVGAVFGWQNASSVMGWWWAIMISLIALALSALFLPRWAPIAGATYSVLSGVLLGALSKEYETLYDGIVFLALTATVVVFVVALTLYVTGVVRVTERFRATIIVGIAGIGVFYLVTWVLSLFGINVPLVTGAGPGAIAFSLFVILLVSLGLMLDFDMIDRGIAEGAPQAMTWFAAFGLITSMVWIYVEILRLLVILARRTQ